MGRLELSGDQSALTLSGIRVPDQAERASLQQELASRLRALSMQSEHRFAEISQRLDQHVESAYLEIGKTRFGFFSETFQLPADVDLEKVEASCRDGVLRIVLPKMAPSRPTFRQGYGLHAPGLASGHAPQSRSFSDLHRGGFASPFSGFRDFW